eukprot:9471263-Pyramimonas_sp.AAC.1
MTKSVAAAIWYFYLVSLHSVSCSPRNSHRSTEYKANGRSSCMYIVYKCIPHGECGVCDEYGGQSMAIVLSMPADLGGWGGDRNNCTPNTSRKADV